MLLICFTVNGSILFGFATLSSQIVRFDWCLCCDLFIMFQAGNYPYWVGQNTSIQIQQYWIENEFCIFDKSGTDKKIFKSKMQADTFRIIYKLAMYLSCFLKPFCQFDVICHVTFLYNGRDIFCKNVQLLWSTKYNP